MGCAGVTVTRVMDFFWTVIHKVSVLETAATSATTTVVSHFVEP